MDSNELFKNGVTWVRADFHLHTKADSAFKYKGEECCFAREYVGAMLKENIRIGIITNHNKFDLEEFKNLRKEANNEGVFLIPGIEFSITDGSKGLHLLIAFAADQWINNSENKNYIQQFIESAFAGMSNYDKEPYPNSHYNLQDTYNSLNQFKKDYFFVLAHVDDSSGLFKELSERNLESFISCEAFKEKVLAIQKSRSYENQKKLPKIAFVEGTDNAEKGIEGIGKGNEVGGITQKTFLKMGCFSFEALKFALRDYSDRVKSILPETKNSHIQSLDIEGGKMDGMHIDFSAELNNFIGIRGSGKSAILEILRYTLDLIPNDCVADGVYKNNLIQFMLGSGAKVVVTIINSKHDQYRVEKIYGQKKEIFDINGNKLEGVGFEGISFKNPIYFGQKDLSNKNDSFENDLLNRLIGDKFKGVDNEINVKCNEIKETLFELGKLDDLRVRADEIKQQLLNANERLKKYKEKGIEEKLIQQTQFDSDTTKIDNLIANATAYNDKIKSLVRDHEFLFSQDINSELNKEIFDELNHCYNDLKTEYGKLGDIIGNNFGIIERMKVIDDKLYQKKNGFKEEFAKVKRELNSDTINPDEFISINKSIQINTLKLSEYEKSIGRELELREHLSSKIEELEKLWLKKYNIFQGEISRINEPDGKLSINIEYKGRRECFKNKLMQVFKGSGIYETTYDRIVEQFEDFVDIYSDKSRINSIITNESQMLYFTKTFNDFLPDLLTFKVDDKITINYDGKPLEQHSLGQRASALVMFLLAQQENDILIIDQPEDDLDNRTIYDEVIKQVKKLKGNMQFIFATHNANIPVLGDSEKIVACYFANDKESLKQGTIDDSEIQKSVVSIMEGGKEAFKKRNSIYSYWKTN